MIQAIDRMAKVGWEEAKDKVDVNYIECFKILNIKNIFDEQHPIVYKRVFKGKAPWRTKR